MVKSTTVTVTATAATTLTITCAPTSGYLPLTVAVSGILKNPAGAGIPNEKIDLYIQGTFIGSVNTKSDGSYSLSVSITVAGTFTFQTQFAGDAGLGYDACSSPTVSVTATLQPTSISISVSPTSGTAPFTVSIAGMLKDNSGFGLGSKEIDLYVNGTKTATTATDSSGNYSFSLSITSAGSYTIQTQFPGDATYAGCEQTGRVTTGPLSFFDTLWDDLVAFLTGIGLPIPPKPPEPPSPV
jgi:hypothetical protein